MGSVHLFMRPPKNEHQFRGYICGKTLPALQFQSSSEQQASAINCTSFHPSVVTYVKLLENRPLGGRFLRFGDGKTYPERQVVFWVVLFGQFGQLSPGYLDK
jgi:hypothetical protein